jgi:hypothetical protein
LAVRPSGQEEWLIVDRVTLEGLICPDKVDFATLAGNKRSGPVVLVTGLGDTRRFVYILAILTDGPLHSTRLKPLLDAYHEGPDTKIRYGPSGHIDALTLQYAAMHEVADEDFPGHIILARTYTWVPAKQRFVHGSLYVDTEAEKRLTWLETIRYVGNYRLGVSHKHDPQTKTSTRWFKPSGILLDKLPKDLRLAPKVEVVTDESGKVISIRGIGSASKT